MQAKEFIGLLEAAGACKAGIRCFKLRHKPRTKVEYTLQEWILDSWYVLFSVDALDGMNLSGVKLTKAQQAIRPLDVLWPHDALLADQGLSPLTIRETFVIVTPESIINDLKTIIANKS